MLVVQNRTQAWSKPVFRYGPEREFNRVQNGNMLAGCDSVVAVTTVPPTQNYNQRLLDTPLAGLVGAFPAVLINGPRATGKTTTARQLAAGEVRLDQPGQAAAFRADPDAALRDRPEPLLLDEWQEVPDILGAVKRAVVDDPRPGRFILTGSVRSDLENKVWPGTGRLVRVQMYGLTQREIAGGAALTGPSMLEKIAMRSAAAFALPATRPDLRDYITMATRGGFPGAVLNTTPEYTDVWVDSYLEQLLTRDTSPSVATRDHQKLEAYFRALASMSAGMPEHKTVYDAAGIDLKTANTYDKLLADLFVAEQVPAWAVNHLDRLIKTPKRYVVDSSLMAASLGADIDTILDSSDLLGRMIDTYVMAQLRPEVAGIRKRIRLYHARTKGGREEVDIVAELPGGKLIGIEMKASASPDSSSAKHLRWLRAENPKHFIAGVVFHTGPDVIQFDDDIFAVPICAFWG